jgi:RNA polymerase sigma factor (sigma-70 family)
MFLQLSGVGDQKIEYKDHSNIKFDSLDTYLLLAKKAISKFGNAMYSGLSSKMLKDEEAISSIANAIMMADWRWDENYENEQNTKKTKYSYRNQCAIWAIKTYITKNYEHKQKTKKKVYSLDYKNDSDGSNNDSSVHELVQNMGCCSPDEILIANEEEDHLIDTVKELLDCPILTERQRDYIKLYYFENQTFEQIGNKYNITREAVRQGLNKTLETIRSLCNE